MVSGKDGVAFENGQLAAEVHDASKKAEGQRFVHNVAVFREGCTCPDVRVLTAMGAGAGFPCRASLPAL